MGSYSSAAISELIALIGAENVSTKQIDRLALCRDASLYRLVPAVVVRPKTTHDVIETLRWCNQHNNHATFRAAGTSLSGQAVTDGVLIDISRNWSNVNINEDGLQVTVQPGVTGGRVNALLRKYGRKLGPDPASINAAMIGGIVANNASGMCCGTLQNSYHTVSALTYTLVDGTTVDTSDKNSDDKLRSDRIELYKGLLQLRNEVRGSEMLVEKIRRKYSIKNTIGYSLNAFLDQDLPSEILGRLMIGSEGTLGFVNSVTYNTIPDALYKLTALMVFGSIDLACSVVDTFKSAGAAAVELMDDASLSSFSTLITTPDKFRFTQKGIAALLVEFHCATGDQCVEKHEQATRICAELELLNNVEWTTDLIEQQSLWKLRKGLMPTIGAMRSPGDTMINEDIAVPPQHLAELIKDVQKEFENFGYHGAIIFGHAKDGNIHYVLNQKLDSPAALKTYDGFMHAIADIVVGKYNGSLKAEHGTGRNMAPFVEMEWGSEAYALMKRIKQLVDPNCVLNPDVIFSTDSEIHLKNIKPLPTIDAEVDACIECGFCEHVCPTRNTHTTPRQRIVLRREMKMMYDAGAPIEEFLRDYDDSVVDSCAADSVCSLVCPVGIDTGAHVKSIRAEKRGIVSNNIASVLGNNYGVVDAVSRFSAVLAHKLPLLANLASPVIKFIGTPSSRSTSRFNTNSPKAYLFSGCPSRWYSTLKNGTSESNKLMLLAEKAGLRMSRISDPSLCCGQPFDSKGFPETAKTVMKNTLRHIQKVVKNSNAVIVVDTSTCSNLMQHFSNEYQLKLISEAEFLLNSILPKLHVANRLPSITVHTGCGVNKSHEESLVYALADACCTNVRVLPATCCGMAGDHGIRYPEILKGAIQNFELEIVDEENFVTCNTTCQAGLSYAVGKPFMSLSDMVLKVTTSS